MRVSMLRNAAVAAVAALGVTAGAAVAQTPVSTTQLVNNPTRYDRQPISVTGTIRAAGGRTLRLCNGPCVTLTHAGYLQRHLNERMTVYGRFRAVDRINGRRYYNVVVVR